MFFPGREFTFPNFLIDVFSIFIFVIWMWLLITIALDLFRRTDTGGIVKVLWVIFLIILPYIGAFIYIITQGRGMAERNRQRLQGVHDEIRRIAGFSPADELDKLTKLRSTSVISDAEYQTLRSRIING